MNRKRSIVAVVVAVSLPFGACATQGGMSANQSNSGQSNSDGSRSDNSATAPSDNSEGSSDSNSESGGSSDSNSETSGTVTTRGSNPDATDATGTLLTTALVLIGATTVATAVFYSMNHGVGRVEAQRRDIRMELARGDGALTREIAEHLAVSGADVAVVGQALKSRRAEIDLWLAADEPLDEARLRGFLLALIHALKAEPRLAARVDALHAALGGTPTTL